MFSHLAAHPKSQATDFYLRLQKLNRFHFCHFEKKRKNKHIHIQWAAIHPALRTQGKLGEKNDDVSHDIEFNPHNECLNGKSTTIHKHHTNTLKLVHLIYFVM